MSPDIPIPQVFSTPSHLGGGPQSSLRVDVDRSSAKLPLFSTRSTYHAVDGPGAYFLTFTTYGSWLPGDERSFVDNEHNRPNEPRIAPDPERREWAAQQLVHPPVVFNLAQRECILDAILEVCVHRGWWAHAVHARTNHVHAVVSAAVKPEKVMNDFKAYATRGLRKSQLLSREIDPVWTEHGSTRYLWNDDQFAKAMTYVRDEQGQRGGYGEGPIPSPDRQGVGRPHGTGR